MATAGTPESNRKIGLSFGLITGDEHDQKVFDAPGRFGHVISCLRVCNQNYPGAIVTLAGRPVTGDACFKQVQRVNQCRAQTRSSRRG